MNYLNIQKHMLQSNNILNRNNHIDGGFMCILPESNTIDE